MTRGEAIFSISNLLHRSIDVSARQLAEEILTTLDTALVFESEIIQLEAKCISVSKVR